MRADPVGKVKCGSYLSCAGGSSQVLLALPNEREFLFAEKKMSASHFLVEPIILITNVE